MARHFSTSPLFSSLLGKILGESVGFDWNVKLLPQQWPFVQTRWVQNLRTRAFFLDMIFATPTCKHATVAHNPQSLTSSIHWIPHVQPLPDWVTWWLQSSMTYKTSGVQSCGNCSVCIFQPIQLETKPARQPRIPRLPMCFVYTNDAKHAAYRDVNPCRVHVGWIVGMYDGILVFKTMHGMYRMHRTRGVSVCVCVRWGVWYVWDVWYCSQVRKREVGP